MALPSVPLLPLADTWGMHNDMGDGWGIVMILGMILFWATVIVLVVWAVRSFTDGSRGAGGETPRQILERRLAEGEISSDEYDELLAKLSPPDR